MRTFELTFAGGETLKVPGGRYFRILSADADLTVVIMDNAASEVGRASGVRGGFAYRRELGFDQVQITSASAQTIKVATSKDAEIEYDRSSGDVSVIAPTGLSDVADVALAATATTLIAAANSTRREIIITNLSTDTQTLRIGTINAGAARGTPLAPGATLILSTTAAVYGYNPGAAPQSVAVSEVTG